MENLFKYICIVPLHTKAVQNALKKIKQQKCANKQNHPFMHTNKNTYKYTLTNKLTAQKWCVHLRKRSKERKICSLALKEQSAGASLSSAGKLLDSFGA